uniref:Uncharacterized protein n=1 Tax=Anopheles atroparvus TaxID=41427 RepID=A0AAG5D1N7_ANOAO
MPSVVDKHLWKIFHDRIIRSYFSVDNTLVLTKIQQTSNLCFAFPHCTAVSISFCAFGKTKTLENKLHSLFAPF